MAKFKPRTNEQAFRALLNYLHPMEVGLFRERVLAIVDMTRDQIKADPKPFYTIISTPTTYLNLCDKIEMYLKIEE